MDREMRRFPSLKENTFVFFYERLHVLSRHTTASFHFPEYLFVAALAWVSSQSLVGSL